MNLSPALMEFTLPLSSPINLAQQIDFLDTTVNVNDSRELYTTLYEKPTYTHLYLRYTSSHHNPGKQSKPYGHFLRLRRICTLEFEENSEKLIQYYL